MIAVMATLPAIDPTRPQTAIQRHLVSAVLTKPGTWFYSNVASRIDPWLIRISRGHLDSGFGTAPIVLLTVRGARSGIERTVPLLYFTDGEDVIVMASSFGRPRYPAWYHNLKANPDVTLYSRGREGRYRAAETEGADRDRLYALAATLYRGYNIYEDRVEGIRRVPVMRLSPI
jgi:deazaflavin-dependent oxidoreductase (nitroreductase family)